MSMTLSCPSLSLHPSLSHGSPHHRPVAFLSHHHHRRRRLLSIAAAIRQDTTTWTEVPLTNVSCAGERLCYVTADLTDFPGLAANFIHPGQCLNIRIPPAIVSPPPALFYIASRVAQKNEFEFLVKSVPGKTAEVLCTLNKGDVVELGEIEGSGIDIDKLSPPENYPTVLLFTTGYGISPIRSLIETGFSAEKRFDVRLYYGAENLQRMAYKERIKIWEDSGVKVTQVLSEPPPDWPGARGHVQDVYAKDKPIADPKATVAVLCGNPNMIMDTRALLEYEGVPPQNILVT